MGLLLHVCVCVALAVASNCVNRGGKRECVPHDRESAKRYSTPPLGSGDAGHGRLDVPRSAHEHTATSCKCVDASVNTAVNTGVNKGVNTGVNGGVNTRVQL